MTPDICAPREEVGHGSLLGCTHTNTGNKRLAANEVPETLSPSKATKVIRRKGNNALEG